MQHFLNFLDKANLIDLGLLGQGLHGLIVENLAPWSKLVIDRAHSNASWINLFPETQITHLPRLSFDHCPTLLQTQKILHIGLKPFRFEPLWMKHQSFIDITTRIWQTQQGDISQTISNFQNELSVWNKHTFGDIYQEIKRTKETLCGLQKAIQYKQDSQLLKTCKKKFKNLLEYEESEIQSKLAHSGRQKYCFFFSHDNNHK